MTDKRKRIEAVWAMVDNRKRIEGVWDMADNRKRLDEDIHKYRSRLQPKIDKICDEYAHDMQQFVIDLHKDIFNKFSDEDDWDEFMCAVAVIQSLLFDQVCRTMAPVASEKYWNAVLDNMHGCCIERCKVWLKIYQEHQKENKNVSMD